MARLLAVPGETSLALTEGWSMALTPPGAWTDPGDLDPAADWITAEVPGTAAAALHAAGQFDPDRPMPLHDKDVWYRCRIVPNTIGRHRLAFDGLATIAEVWLDGRPILASETMYGRHCVPVDLAGPAELVIAFRALVPRLERRGPRARWRTRLVTHQGLRHVRTTLLGHMPGWCPEVHAVGPWRDIRLLKPGAFFAEDVHLQAQLEDDGTGLLRVTLELTPTPDRAVLRCGGAEAVMDRTGDRRLEATLTLPKIEPWWPHTHGTPALHTVAIETPQGTIDLGRTGFRRISIDRGGDGEGFRLIINGVPVFCRGAVWTNADILRFPGREEDYRPWLERARAGQMNMLRIAGTMAYETPAFFELCDELGLMVWQDFALANFDYPVAEPRFAELVAREADDLLDTTQASPSLVVACGGSEMFQQAAMMGLPEERWRGPLTEEILPAAVSRWRPDVVYVPNSPSGGAMPFSPGTGIAHYYGVSAYRRPFEDARRANVRFAAECLAFANVPEQETLDAELPEVMPGHDPRWKARVPRDRGVGWDFEDIRDHYVSELYGVDPLELRYGDPARYLDLGRAASAEAMEAVFAEWRRTGSRCGGGLVWTFQDLMPGAGWGVVDATGRPKPAWYALRRAFRPVTLFFTDEGSNGLDVHLVNDTGVQRAVRVDVACLRAGRTPVAQGTLDLELLTHGARRLPATDLFGAFFDTTYAFRFGPPSHDVVHGRLIDRHDGTVLADAFHFPLGRAAALHEATLTSECVQVEAGTWILRLATDRLAQSVHIADAAFEPEDNWFHLVPGAPRALRLTRRRNAPAAAVPAGEVRSLSPSAVLRYSAAAAG